MNLKELLAAASPKRSGDELAGIAAATAEARVRAQMKLADVPLRAFLDDPIIPYEQDDVTRLICDSHDAAAFAPVAHLTVGEFRDWLLSEQATAERLSALSPGLIPEMVAAVSKLMRLQDLVSVARKRPVVTGFRSTIGLPGRLATRLQPNHPADDPKGIAASIFDGLTYGNGDAVIGVNPATDNVGTVEAILRMLDQIRERYAIPTQICVLAHVTTQMEALQPRRAGGSGIPVDRRHRGGECLLRRDPAHAGGRPSGCPRSSAAAST